MKKLFLSLGFAAMLGMAACSEDFEVAAPYEEVTVVYGIWDKGDTAHYVRIQKSFLDEQKSAIDMSKVSDSSYYRDVTVEVKELKGNTIVSNTVLSKVDLTAEGYVKEQPANEQGFFTSPHLGYKYTKALDVANKYRLVITNNETGDIDSAEVNIVAEPTTNSFPSNNFEIEFARTRGNFAVSVGETPFAKFYEVIMRFHYVDINIVTQEEVSKQIELHLGRTISNGRQARVEIENSVIHQFLAKEIGPAPSTIARRMETIDVLLFAGSSELYQYEQLANNGAGITADQIRPNFTNVLGDDAIGLLATKSHNFYNGYPIGKNTVDSLMLNDLTQPLNIIKP